MLVAVIPAYNEGSRIRDVVVETKKYVDLVVVVNDGSQDNTVSQASVKDVIVLSHIINLGKGAAARTGCDWAVENGATQIVLLDGDGQHEAQDIPRFVKELGKHDIVFGRRKKSKNMPGLYRVGNKGLNVLSKIFFGITLQDSQCGFRAMNASVYKSVRWDASDYAMESEMIVRAGIKNLSHTEISIRTIYHDRYKGTGVIDGVKILVNMLKWRLTMW